MPNRLAEATSPYLLQHADNPVDWYEWGEDAFAEAHTNDRPVLLSVGYAACHWCHVMAHESFEDGTTAAYMNENFINVKVDREERPDLDRIYMDAVQAMTGHGGWPMTVFLTPDGEPFYAGTYFPKEPRGHHPTFMQVLSGISTAWRERRSEIEQQAGTLTNAVRNQLPEAVDARHDGLIDQSIRLLEERFDSVSGGFGGAPKFPQAPTLELLLRVAAGPEGDMQQRSLRMLTKTLDEMAAGGIYDHLYGGFARYSVDAIWLVPHFEKMLYDNALLGRIYTHAWSITKNADYRRVAEETLDYLANSMRHPSGGILSAEDADSEGSEGKFAVWSAAEFASVTGPDAALMAAVYGVSESGNFEGTNILSRKASLESVAAEFGISERELTERRHRGDAKLAERRRTRVPPAVDDKVVMAWNGLAMRTFAEAAVALQRPDYLDVAIGIARFVKSDGTLDDGRLARAWRDGRTSGPGYCDDYGAIALGLFALYQSTGNEEWFTAAISVTDDMIRLFANEDGPGFYATGSDMPALIARPMNLMDNPTPSDNSLAAEALAVRAALTGEALDHHVEGVARAAGLLLAKHPTAVGHLLAVLAVLPMRQLAIVAPPGEGAELLAVAAEAYRPEFVVARGDTAPSVVPLLADRGALGGQPTAYVCEGFACKLPTGSPDELRSQLADSGRQIPAAPGTPT